MTRIIPILILLAATAWLPLSMYLRFRPPSTQPTTQTAAVPGALTPCFAAGIVGPSTVCAGQEVVFYLSETEIVTANEYLCLLDNQLATIDRWRCSSTLPSCGNCGACMAGRDMTHLKSCGKPKSHKSNCQTACYHQSLRAMRSVVAARLAAYAAQIAEQRRVSQELHNRGLQLLTTQGVRP